MFDYFISLGSLCPIAASMGRYGLRSFSGPFDWLITEDFSWVLHYLETDFADFLLQENLERYDEYPRHFLDIQSDVRFTHEAENFLYDYDKLKDKYDRRIKNFQEKTRFKVCYLRSMHTKQDFEYILQNAEYIKCVITKNNSGSEIVFLCNSDVVGGSSFPFRYYNMPRAWDRGSQTALRSYFDHADDFLTFCGENYSGVNLMKNLMFDFEKDYSLLDVRRYKTLTTLLTYDFSRDIKSDKTIIYGAGMIGQELYKKIKNFTSVICFIDQYKRERDFEGIPIIQFDEVKPKEGTKVIVSVTYDFQNIKEGLTAKFQNEDIISLDDILNLKF